MPRIFDNIRDPLAPALQQSLTDFRRFDVAVGYFNLRGWGALADQVGVKAAANPDQPVARILIGMMLPTDADSAIDDLQRQLDGSEALRWTCIKGCGGRLRSSRISGSS